jgi:hypothetical protein
MPILQRRPTGIDLRHHAAVRNPMALSRNPAQTLPAATAVSTPPSATGEKAAQSARSI